MATDRNSTSARQSVHIVIAVALLASGTGSWAAASEGMPDPSFGTNGRVTIGIDVGGNLSDVAEAVASYPGNRIVVAGSAVVDLTGSTDIAVVRLQANGTADPTFGTAGFVVYGLDLGGSDFDSVADVLVQPDGAILILARASTAPGSAGMAVTRLLADGTADPAFGSNGTWSFSSPLGEVEPAALALRSNGDIMVGGRFGAEAVAFRLSSAGSLLDFGSVEVPGLQTIADMAMTADGGLILVGSRDVSAPDYDFLVTRLTSSLDSDPTFGTSAGWSSVPFDLGGTNGDFATAVGLLPDGSIVVAGSAATALGDDAAVLRLTANGTWTAGGRTHFGFYADDANDDWVADLAIQSDGAVIVAGTVAFDGTLDHDFGIARLAYAGSGWALDASFPNGGAFWLPFDVVPAGDDDGLAVTLTGEGIVVAGRCRTAVDTTDMAVARLMNGSIFANGFESGDLWPWSIAVGVNG